MQKYNELQDLILGSNNIVFFGGAGVSTESGIPDFRSVDGLYNQKYSYPPETILSHSFFISNTEYFYDFYKNKMVFLGALPNKAHIRLAELERVGKLKAVITQNIDGLHQKAGSKNVLELHGSVHRNYCMKCGTFWLEANCSLPKKKRENFNNYLVFLLLKVKLLTKLQNRPRRMKPRLLEIVYGL